MDLNQQIQQKPEIIFSNLHILQRGKQQPIESNWFVQNVSVISQKVAELGIFNVPLTSVLFTLPANYRCFSSFFSFFCMTFASFNHYYNLKKKKITWSQMTQIFVSSPYLCIELKIHMFSCLLNICLQMFVHI